MFTARSDQVAEARAFIRGVLKGHPVQDSAVLVVSELATNSVQHSLSGLHEGPFIVTVEVRGVSVRVGVLDLGSESGPSLGVPPDEVQENGRGLWLVALLSKEWGTESLESECLRVWAELVPDDAP